MTRGGRLALSLAALVFAGLALFSGLDRHSEHEPGAVGLVPENLRASSWEVAAAQALSQGEAARAGELAAEAVSANPLDPEAVSLFAASRLAAGERIEAGRAFEVASLLGFRTPLVQAYFFDIAIASGNAEAAADRLDVLLAVQPSMAANGYFFSALEQVEGGRSELARRLQEPPDWADAYLTGFRADNASLAARAAFLARQAGEVPLGCERIEPMLRELARRSMRGEAMRLAQGQCPERALAQALIDPGFETLGEDSAFGWRRHGSGDLRISSIGRKEKMVEVENRSATTRLVLSQLVALEPGEYRIFASVAGGPRDAVIASLDCGAPKRPSGRGGSLGRGQLVSVPDCDDLTLGIWIKPAAVPLQLDDLRISPVG